MIYSNNKNSFYDEPDTLEQPVNEDSHTLNGSIFNENELLENMLVDLVSRMDDDSRKAYMESSEFQNLLEAGVVGRRSIVRISKNDDLTRRIHLAAIQAAKEAGDADWEALRKNRVKERELLNRIYKKYAMKVRGDAVRSQRRLIKLSPKAFDMTKQVR